jgi:2-hydroxychromene-2-carboxylate isomerase
MRVELWFDFSCPYAYLASTQIEALCARTGATLDARPMLLGGVFRARAVPQKLFAAISPAKARHNALDLERWARRFGVPYDGMPSGHPFRTVEALRALLVVGAPFMPLAHAFFRAYWVEGRDLGERAVLVDVLTRAGHDAERALTAAEAPAIKDELRARTDEAIARGVFGAPAMFVGHELYWGQDRLDDVERALGGTPPATEALRVDDVEATLYFDPACPHVALALPRAAATYARLRYVPLSLDDLLRRHYPPEGVLPAASEAKQRYLSRDLARRAPALARGLAAGRSWPLPSERNGVGFLALVGQEAPCGPARAVGGPGARHVGGGPRPRRPGGDHAPGARARPRAPGLAGRRGRGRGRAGGTTWTRPIASTCVVCRPWWWGPRPRCTSVRIGSTWRSTSTAGAEAPRSPRRRGGGHDRCTLCVERAPTPGVRQPA